MIAPRPWAAVSLVEREDGRILCVWNKRYGGWAMPGGLVEEGETLEEGQVRELFEETGLVTIARELVYEGKPNTSKPGRGSYCYVFWVKTAGEPAEREVGHAVTWFTPEEFLQWSPFAEFYRPLLEPKP